MTIFKYTMTLEEKAFVEMPLGARVLSVGQQDDPRKLVVWAIVDPARSEGRRCFRIFGTGHPFDLPSMDGTSPPFATFVGTVQTQLGLVWHVFDCGWAT